MSRTLPRLIAGLALVATPAVMTSTVHAGALVEETMTLTAEGGTTARLGKHVTIAFKDDAIIDGNFFWVWVCPDTTRRPDANVLDNGGCEEIFIWGREQVVNYVQSESARTMSWLLSTENAVPGLQAVGGEPYKTGSDLSIMVSSPQGGWCSLAGKYLIVQDFDTLQYPVSVGSAMHPLNGAGVDVGDNDKNGTNSGGHSNFLQIDSNCDGTATTTAAPATTAAALPDTGMGTTPSLLGVITLLAGAAVISVRRLRTA